MLKYANKFAHKCKKDHMHKHVIKFYNAKLNMQKMHFQNMHKYELYMNIYA